MENHLHKEKSPYLLQHRDNPVHWYPWGEEAFRRAEAEDKPIFLSIGYSTCHWCHVMAHESFEDAEVAEALNRDYICVKVDREERPDIDAVYMAVCQALTGSGGWPLTVLMTAEQKPFFAGTYFPKKTRHGQMGLLELLRQVAGLWSRDREKLLAAGDRITALLRQSQPSAGGEPDEALVRKAYETFRQSFDRRWGGFGAAPKFPTPHNLIFLLRYARQENQPQAQTMAEATLESMARGGIHDHIGGGFSRYSTDETWLVPHFEKMLYDNALLLLAYTQAYAQTGKDDYADTARRTADYILRELTDPAGGFYSAQDADSEGVEGKYYLFTPGEVLDVLGETVGQDFCQLYDITEKGNFEGQNIPNLIRHRACPWPQDDPRLEKLRQFRRQRTALHRDDKVLLSWNAWAILALSQAGTVLGEARYLEAACRAQAFIQENMTDEKDRLFLRWREGQAAHAGQLDDYAVYALALLSLYRTSLDSSYLSQAFHRAGQMVEFFEDRAGGFYLTAHDAEALIARPKETYDGAIPSGNAVAGLVLEVLAGLSAEPRWRKAADRQLSYLAAQAASYPAGHSFALLAVAQALGPHRLLVCCAKERPPELQSLQQPDKELLVLFKSPENAEELARCAPFTADYPIPEHGARWYLCENGRCLAPAEDFRELPL